MDAKAVCDARALLYVCGRRKLLSRLDKLYERWILRNGAAGSIFDITNEAQLNHSIYVERGYRKLREGVNQLFRA